MHCLEVIVANNANLAHPCNRPNGPSGEGLSVTHNGRGLIEVQKHGRTIAVVDCTNPLIDGPLCEFHRTWKGPGFIANQVEAIASQFRRIVSAEAGWSELVADAAWHHASIAA